ncbi:cytochrome P450 [Anaeromyxobacter oryzae]|uniref:Cytochrome P450 n=1 Tax=Anaeromyxobacter oryzae TaxID=2918170 RepID=A0ABM7WXW8_9BACT|nr:cytochrome P450 [Anaeromyxobacter oryzae]BDG04369.1 cytochrome P450 [Anaeromyxobacter oryzae]
MTPALPPGPRTLRPGGSWRAFGRDPLGFLERLARTYGPVAHFRIGPRHVFVLSDPDLVREVLVVSPERFRKDRGLEMARVMLGDGLLTAHGETWRRHRRLAQPAFHPDRIAGAAAVMARRAAARVARWRDGDAIDAHREMAALALEIVAEALFGADVEAEIPAIARALDDAVESFRMSRIPFAPLLDRLPVPSTVRVHRARRTLDAILYRMIAARRAAGGGGDDLLGRLLAARDAEGGGALSDLELRDEAMTIFLAGHETTGDALAWTIDLLGRNPGARARLEAEVDAVLGGRPPAPADVDRLPYARRVLTEGMRLYPPAWTLARQAIADVPLGGFVLPARATAMLPQWVIHRDPGLYPEPDRFDPDRWLPERRAGLPRLAYFPFGAGPRICIGEGFAWTEGVLALAAIASRVRLVPLAPVPPVPLPRITLRPGGGVPVRVELRRPAQPTAAPNSRPTA